MSFPNPEAAESAFYAAFKALDSKAMSLVWISSPDASCIHPGGPLLQGTDRVLESWLEIFRDSTPPTVKVRLIQASSDSHLAVHTVEESISSGGGTRHAVVLATNIYVRRDGGWRMLAHHASLPLVEKSIEPAEPPALH
ncbi:MAG: nuclear transport factor 2 family protein [Gammaproteobacteria bacterium]|nr:nuclear transport factor 2 family protein [Gammaproteobacteria bacterium]